MKTVPPHYTPSLRVPFQFAWDAERCTRWLDRMKATGRWRAWVIFKSDVHYGYLGFLFNG